MDNDMMYSFVDNNLDSLIESVNKMTLDLHKTRYAEYLVEEYLYDIADVYDSSYAIREVFRQNIHGMDFLTSVVWDILDEEETRISEDNYELSYRPY